MACLRTDAQGREHLSLSRRLLLLLGPVAMILVSLVAVFAAFECVPRPLPWAEAEPPQMRTNVGPIGRSKPGLTGGPLVAARVQNSSCLIYSRIQSALCWAAQPHLFRDTAPAWEPSCHWVPLLELRPTSPTPPWASGWCQTWMKWGHTREEVPDCH